MSNFILAELVGDLPMPMQKIQRQALTEHHQILRSKKNKFVEKRRKEGRQEHPTTKIIAHNIMRGGKVRRR